MFFSKTSLGLRAALFVLFLATLLFAVFPGTVDRLQPLQRAIVRAGNEQQAEYDFHWQYKRLPGETPAEKGRRLNCLMSADIAHAQVLNKGVPVESTVEEFIEVSDLNEEGWIKTDDQPHYGSTGLPNTLQQLTGASYSSLHYDMIRHHQYGMRGNIPIGVRATSSLSELSYMLTCTAHTRLLWQRHHYTRRRCPYCRLEPSSSQVSWLCPRDFCHSYAGAVVPGCLWSVGILFGSE